MNCSIYTHSICIPPAPLPGVSAVEQCSRLTSLDLSHCRSLTDVEPLQHCRRLSSLKLNYCSQLADVSPLAGCGSLRTLELSFSCRQLADLAPLQHCGSLHTLNLRSCSQLTDVSGRLTPLATPSTAHDSPFVFFSRSSFDSSSTPYL